MQDNKPKNQSPDDDIIQSKADLRELLQSAGFPVLPKQTDEQPKSESPPVAGISDGSPRPEEILLDAEFLELADDKSSPDSEHSTTPDRENHSEKKESVKESPILPLEPENKQQDQKPAVHRFHAVTPSPPAQKTLESPDNQDTAEKLRQAEKELWKKEQLLKQEQKRMAFFEQQLQNAVVLERAKSRYQQEVEKLSLQNQQLTAEITQLKNRLEDLYGKDTQVQRLHEELTSANTALSEQQALTRQVKDAMGALQNELAAYKQKEHESQVRYNQYKQQIEDMKAGNRQLQEEHKRILDETHVEHENAIQQKNAELEKTVAELAGIRSNYQKLRDDFDQIRHEYEAFQTQANEEIRMLTESTDILTDENAHLSDEIQHAQSQKQQLKTMLEKLQASQADLDHLREQLKQEQQTSERLRYEYQQLETDIARVRQEKDELSESVASLQTNEVYLKAEINQLRNTAGDKTTLQEKLQTNEVDLAQLREQLQHERGISENIRQEYHELEANITHIRHKKDELAQCIASLQANEERLEARIEQLSDAAADNDVLQEKLLEAQSRIDLLVDENQSLRHQIDEVQTSPADEPRVSEAEPLFSTVESDLHHNTEADYDDDIPVFNLADQIMAEHRRSVASRRQRVKSTPASQQAHSIKDVIGHFIPSSDRSRPAEQIQTTPSHSLWTDQSLTAFQREILREIVRKDMELGTENKFTMTNYSSMQN